MGAFAASSSGAPAARPAPGAAVLPAQLVTPLAEKMPESYDFITPDPLSPDVPDSSGVCFQSADRSEVLWCTYGNPAAKTTVALVGDSKMDQWLPAFQLLATQNDWKVVIAAKAGCPFTSARTVSGVAPYPTCDEWNRKLLAQLKAERPAYVFTSQSNSVAADAGGKQTVAAMIAGVRASWRAVEAAGSKLVVMANNPYPGLKVDPCVDQNRKKLSACSFSRDLHDQDQAYQMQRRAVAGTGVQMIDLWDFICPTLRCPPVIGKVLVYRGGSHLTASYVKTLTPRLATALAAIGIPVRFTPVS